MVILLQSAYQSSLVANILVYFKPDKMKTFSTSLSLINNHKCFTYNQITPIRSTFEIVLYTLNGA